MEFEQFKNRKQNIAQKQKDFNRHKRPKQKCSAERFEPQKILYKQSKEQINQAQSDKKNRPFDEFIEVIFSNKSF